MRNIAMRPERTLSRQSFRCRVFTTRYWVLALSLLLSRPLLAQPPGSAAAEKVIRNFNVVSSRPSTADDMEAMIASAAPDFTCNNMDGTVEKRADWVSDMRNWLPDLAATVDDHQVVSAFRWQNGKAVVTVSDDMKTRLFRSGLYNPFESQSVVRDTWERAGKVWMRQNTAWVSSSDWIDGQLQK